MGFTGSASDSTGTGFEMNVMVALILGGLVLDLALPADSKKKKAEESAFNSSIPEEAEQQNADYHLPPRIAYCDFKFIGESSV